MRTNIFVEAGREWQRHNASRLAAALAYYTAFSLAPLLVVFMVVLTSLYQAENSRTLVLEQIQQTLGEPGIQLIQPMLERASTSTHDTTALVLGLALAFYGTISLFRHLRDTVHLIWETKPEPTGIGPLVQRNIALFILLLATGALILLSLVAGAAISGFNTVLVDLFNTPPLAISIISSLLTFVVSASLFAYLFRYLPSKPTSWNASWLAALVTTVLFEVSRHLLSFYLGKASLTSTYGAAGALAAVMFWIYYTEQVFLYGVEFSRQVSKRQKKGITPAQIR